MKEAMKLYRKFLEFEAQSGERERYEPIDREHLEYWNERYWHGYAAAMRHARDRFDEQFKTLVGVQP